MTSPRTLRPLLLFAAALLVLGGFLLQGSLGYQYFLEELSPPPPDAQQEQVAPVSARAERVVIVVLDSVREDLMTDPELMPEMARLADSGGRRGINITQPITMTLLSVLNLGTGHTPGLGWSVQNFEAEAFPDESLFYWAADRELGVAFLGDASWSQLFGEFATFDLTFPDAGNFDAFEDGLAVKDNTAIAKAPEILSQPDTYPLVVLHLVSTDKVSHRHGALSRDKGQITPYGEAGALLDAAVGKLYRDHARDTDLWFITSDHGATDWGTHGGGEEVARRAPFLAVGAGIRPGPAVEVPLNAWAPTLALALGLPIPRTAEELAAFDLLDLTQDEQQRALEQHAERRMSYVASLIEDLEAPRDGLEALEGEAPERAISQINGLIRQLRETRRWRYLMGLALGGLLQIAGLFLLLRARAPGDPALGRRVLGIGLLVWAATLPLLIIADDWLFVLVETVGTARGELGAVPKALLLLGCATAVLWGARRALLKRPGSRATHVAIWLLFALGVVATSQSIIKWPYGPIAATYHLLLLWGLLGAGVLAFRVREQRHVWLIAMVGVLGLMIAHIWSDAQHAQRLTEDDTSALAALVALGLVVLGAAIAVVRREANTRRRWLAGIGGVLMLSAAIGYRAWDSPGVAGWVLLALGGVLAGVVLTRGWRTESRRDLLFALALTLSHVMSTDHVMLITLPLVACAYALSMVRLPQRPWTAALLAFLVGLLDVTLFFTLGYEFSFSSMDVNVVFMLDRTSINLGSGLLLMILQHSPRWILLWTAVVANRVAARDRSGLQLAFVAMMVTFALRTFGPFLALAFKTENFWFISHAVPMFVMSMGAFFLAALWFTVVTISFTGWRPHRGASGA